MKLLLSPDKILTIETSVVNLCGGQPILNGVPLTGWRGEVLRLDSEQIELRYTSELLYDGYIQMTPPLDLRSAFHNLRWGLQYVSQFYRG
jgi:hypothetical protein